MISMTKRRDFEVDLVTARAARSRLRARAFGLALMLVVGPLGCGSAKAEIDLGATATAPRPAPSPAPTPAQSAVVASGDAVLEGDRIKIARPIFYDVDKDEIKPESYPVLTAVANILNTHTEITGLIVEGHTDNQGSFDHNRQLSERRSSAVVRYLASIGVKQPMQAPGYGATAPLCGSDDDACRQMNRRVEFRVKRAQ
jgi:peptidoglycan-associated lipoprotein